MFVDHFKILQVLKNGIVFSKPQCLTVYMNQNIKTIFEKKNNKNKELPMCLVSVAACAINTHFIEAKCPKTA